VYQQSYKLAYNNLYRRMWNVGIANYFPFVPRPRRLRRVLSLYIFFSYYYNVCTKYIKLHMIKKTHQNTSQTPLKWSTIHVMTRVIGWGSLKYPLGHPLRATHHLYPRTKLNSAGHDGVCKKFHIEYEIAWIWVYK
jgi:hypothetical protein